MMPGETVMYLGEIFVLSVGHSGTHFRLYESMTEETPL
jgi:hypothetical protein